MSQARPCWRASQPMPPPRVSPPTPVWRDVAGRGGQAVRLGRARSSAPSSAPPWTRARRDAGSIRTPPIGVRSIMRPPSGTARPATLWPPQRDADLEVEVAGQPHGGDHVGDARRSGRSSEDAGRSWRSRPGGRRRTPGRRAATAGRRERQSVANGVPSRTTRSGRRPRRQSRSPRWQILRCAFCRLAHDHEA